MRSAWCAGWRATCCATWPALGAGAAQLWFSRPTPRRTGTARRRGHHERDGGLAKAERHQQNVLCQAAALGVDHAALGVGHPAEQPAFDRTDEQHDREHDDRRPMREGPLGVRENDNGKQIARQAQMKTRAIRSHCRRQRRSGREYWPFGALPRSQHVGNGDHALCARRSRQDAKDRARGGISVTPLGAGMRHPSLTVQSGLSGAGSTRRQGMGRRYSNRIRHSRPVWPGGRERRPPGDRRGMAAMMANKSTGQSHAPGRKPPTARSVGGIGKPARRERTWHHRAGSR